MRALLLATCLFSTGCIETILTNGEIASTREAAKSFDTLGDYELAKVSTQAGLAQFEGMHRIAPDNEDALFMLVQGWGGYAWGFVEDEMEEAQLERTRRGGRVPQEAREDGVRPRHLLRARAPVAQRQRLREGEEERR